MKMAKATPWDHTPVGLEDAGGSRALRSRTPLHCAASCNSVHLCKQLVESGAAIFASTISDIETAADKCEEMEEGYMQCSQFLYGAWGAAPACACCCWPGSSLFRLGSSPPPRPRHQSRQNGGHAVP